jgi:hypothetical protein
MSPTPRVVPQRWTACCGRDHGFGEAVGIAIPSVAVCLVLNAIVVARRVLTDYGSGESITATALLSFPLLVLGLSQPAYVGALMPPTHVRGVIRS